MATTLVTRWPRKSVVSAAHPAGRALSRPKFRDDTAVVPPKYGRNWSQTSDSFGCPRSARCTDNCIPNRLHERPEGDSGEFGIARAADRRMARGENVASWTVR